MSNMVNIYSKGKKLNYKEKKLIKNLQPIIDKLATEDPNFASSFIPARDYEGLQLMYEKYGIENMEFEDIPDTKETVIEETIKKENTISNMEKQSKEVAINDSIDPFNREEPIVRSYVTDNDIPTQQQLDREAKPSKIDFKEPITFDEAFVLPDEDNNSNKTAGRSNNKFSNMGGMGNANKDKRSTPINPDFDSMTGDKKRKKTKKFAKYIVEAVCLASEKGFVWFATKDINEAKLAEYEIEGSMDLSLLLTLEDGQSITIKQFFLAQCASAEELAKIDKDEQEDLIDSLTDFLLEKGVAPTPAQELLLVAGKIFGGQAIKLFAHRSQTNSLLRQLRAMQEAKNGGGPNPEPERQQPKQEPKPQPQQFKNTEEEITYIKDETKSNIDTSSKNVSVIDSIFDDEPTKE